MKKIFITAVYLLNIVCLYAQNVGIGTTNPQAKLHVMNGDVLFSTEGTLAVPADPNNPPASGSGRRMMWYPDKAAFRAGAVAGNLWDKDNIGNFSFSGGHSTTASGEASTAFGLSVQATGYYSFAGGYASVASGSSSIAMGGAARASGNYSFAGGYSSTASGVSSTAFGNGSQATGDYSFAVGFGGQATHYYSTAMGYFSFAHGIASFAAGSNTAAEGNYSFAANRNTYAASANETVFGQYNTFYNPASQTDWVATDRLFVIGNGSSANARSNAVTVFKNGNVGIMTAQPNARLSVSGDASKTGGGVWAAWSDARLKKNITPYTSGLKEILQINPVRFQYNELSGEEDLDKNFVGIIAQEIEKVLPSTITIKQDSVLKDKRMFDGSELTYTLINAIKEQQQQIEILKKEVAELKKTLNNK